MPSRPLQPDGWAIGHTTLSTGTIRDETSSPRGGTRWPGDSARRRPRASASHEAFQLEHPSTIAPAEPLRGRHGGFLRADLAQSTRVRAFWNRGRTDLRDLNALSQPNLNYDTYDANVEQTVPAGPKNGLVVGASYRQNVVRSRLFGPARKDQELYAVFVEDRWFPAPKLDITASARFDHHPLAGNVVSPRGSIVFGPASTCSARRRLRVPESHAHGELRSLPDGESESRNRHSEPTLLHHSPFGPGQPEPPGRKTGPVRAGPLRKLPSCSDHGHRIPLPAPGSHHDLHQAGRHRPADLHRGQSFINKRTVRAWGASWGPSSRSPAH